MISGLVRWFGRLVIALALLSGHHHGTVLGSEPDTHDQPGQAAASPRVSGVARRSGRSRLARDATDRQPSPPGSRPLREGEDRRLFRRAHRDDPAAFRFPRCRLPETARRFRASQGNPRRGPSRARPDRNPAAPGRVRRAGLRCRMAVLAGDHGDAQADQRAAPRYGDRSGARGRDAARGRRRPGCRFCLRQRGRVPGARLAAPARGDRARLFARVPRFAPRAGDRRFPPRARRQRRPQCRALPDRPDGHGGRAVLACTAGPAGRLVRLWLGHGGSAQRIGLLARRPAPRGLRPRLGPAGDRARDGLAAA